MNKMLKLIGASALVFAITMVAGVPSAEATHKGAAKVHGNSETNNDSQASLMAWVWCSVDETPTPDKFLVNLRLQDISSGGLPITEVTHWSVDALVKAKGNWNGIIEFDTVVCGDLNEACVINPDEEYEEFLPIAMFDVPADPSLKTINASVSITYNAIGGVLSEARPLELRCGDNPNTEETESSGVSLD